MQKINFFNGMEVESTDLNNLEIYFEERINRNQASLTNKGVFVNADLPNGKILAAPYITTDSTTLSIYGFIAYDQEGHLLFLEPSYTGNTPIPSITNLKPENNGTSTLANRKLINTGSMDNFGSNIKYLIVARYDEVLTSDLRKQDVTDVLLPVRVTPTVSFYLRAEGGLINGDVVLGTITSDDFGNVSVDESTRDVLYIKGNLISSSLSQNGENLGQITYEQHINMIGTGNFSSNNPHALSASDIGIDPTATGKHQQYEHTRGIIAEDITQLSSCLAYSFSSATSGNIYDIEINVQPLSSANSEVIAIGDSLLYPSSFPGVLTYRLYQDNTASGYYILQLLKSLNLGLVGPFTSETDYNYTLALQDNNSFAICSFYWGEPRYYTITFAGTLLNAGTAITGWKVQSDTELAVYGSSNTILASEVQVGDCVAYAPTNDYITISSINIPYSPEYLNTKTVDTTTTKDLRYFRTLSTKNINTSDLATLDTGAPIENGKSSCYNARVVSSKSDLSFSLSGLVLSVEFDGVEASPRLTFPTTAFYTPQNVISTINSWIDTSYQGPNTSNKPVAVLNHEGKITLLAAESIIVQDIGITSASSELGFSLNNSDADGLLKAVVSEGTLSSIQEFYYDALGNLSNIYYNLPSGINKQYTLAYTPENRIKGFEGVI